MAIHFLDTPLQKALAFLPNFGGSALFDLSQALKNRTIAKTQEIYLRTLVHEYCAIGMAGCVFFTGMLILAVNSNHASTSAKISYGCFFAYTALCLWTRCRIWEENGAALSELRGY